MAVGVAEGTGAAAVLGWKKQLQEVLRCTNGCVGVSKINFTLFLNPKLEKCFGDISVFLSFFFWLLRAAMG